MTALYVDEIYQALLRLQPPGRAMQSLDGTIKRENSILRQFWYAIAKVVGDFEIAVEAAIAEMFCVTADVDLDLWLQEYGLPDECDPFGSSLCAKVGFAGGTTLADYLALAEALGWSTQMRWLKGDDPEFPGVFATLHIVIDLANSPAFYRDVWTEFGSWPSPAGFVLPTSPLGPPEVYLLICALKQALPAHCDLTHEVF